MSRVSYQVAFDRAEDPAPVFVALDPGAITTKTRDGAVRVSAKLSKDQARWLKRAGAAAGEGTVLRALVDLGMQLETEWGALARPTELRDAVRESVLIRRRRT